MSFSNGSVMLELDKVSFCYRTSNPINMNWDLDSVSFKLYDGETLGVIGKNGSGKTTILRVMAGILPPTTGTVRITPSKTASLLSLGLGFNVQLSGRNNALISAMLQGSNKKLAESYLEGIKEFSELGDSFEEPVKTYSTGMRSRLGFTTALKTKVDILLIDEILSVGDAHFRHKAQAAMRERIGGGQTVVFVSHSEEQIEKLCDRVIWLNRGKIEAEGETAKVLKEYRQHINKIDRSINQ